VLPRPAVFGPAVKLGQLLRPLLPSSWPTSCRRKARARPMAAPAAIPRRMLALAGCVQPALAPNINAATARVLDRLGIELFEEAKAGCCGAVRFHLNDQDAARTTCGATSTPGGRMSRPVSRPSSSPPRGAAYRSGTTATLADDPDYAEKAARISACAAIRRKSSAPRRRTLQTLLAAAPGARGKLAFHSPCTLQHGLKIRGVIEEMAGGRRLHPGPPVADGHLCCGSAGAYSLAPAGIVAAPARQQAGGADGGFAGWSSPPPTSAA
jgi:glycolate oxidase iron-sulfur subunit